VKPQPLFIGGFSTSKWCYLPLVHYYRHICRISDFTVIHPSPWYDIFGFNVWPFSVVQDNINQCIDRKRPVVLIGHSLGGVYALLYMLHNSATIARVITIGTPVVDSPKTDYERIIYKFIEVSDTYAHYDEIRKSVFRFSSRIVTISSPHDTLAPPERCFVENGENYVVDLFSSRGINIAHVALPFIPCTTQIVAKILNSTTS